MNPRYLIISPIKDEEAFVSKTIESVLNQTLRPVAWIIVDDGSTDRTKEVVRNLCGSNDWILFVETGRGKERKTGSAEALAFRKGYALAQRLDYDYLVKLDGDIQFNGDYFEKILRRFEEDEQLGIASGRYFEKARDGWKPVDMPHYHAAGASKVVRRKCFEMIGGFLDSPGWDSIDEIKAQNLGWKTCHFRDIYFLHLKKEGSAMGYLQTSRMHGEIFYLSGGSKPFFLLKIFQRFFFGKPFLLGGIWMGVGFLIPLVKRRRLLVTPEEARFNRHLLNTRILGLFYPLIRRRCACLLHQG